MFAAATTQGAAKNLYELAMNAIVVNAFGLYRVYVDGASQHPMVVAMTGIAKVCASMLFLKCRGTRSSLSSLRLSFQIWRSGCIFFICGQKWDLSHALFRPSLFPLQLKREDEHVSLTLWEQYSILSLNCLVYFFDHFGLAIRKEYCST